MSESVTPGEGTTPVEPDTSATVAPGPVTSYSAASIALASIWALVAIIVAIVLMTTTNSEEYGGDAYTGIQNAVVAAVRGIGWLLIGSGVLGLVIALRRSPR